MIISTFQQPDSDINVRTVDNATLGAVQVRLTAHNYFYLTKDEAYGLFSALESALHDLAQAGCEHPLTHRINNGHCMVCGATVDEEA